MHLKRLELQGFKSFSEKIRLEFNKGITAVVGPNGSGKSNISDAVRWVLGEQNARSLRGSKMEDIIFSGTEKRRPLGFAEVSIIIDNSDRKMNIDFSEIKVTRKVYRSGESEYQINGTACRLKDIHQMFMDTGVGREGYSIIGQGRIEEILSARSEDRRYLFEEAAGIVKYKNRKQEALSKLEKERQNLIRVNDIISELESQIEPLKEQSDKAKIYLDIKEYQKLLQINLFLIEAKRIQQQLDKLEEDISNLNLQIEQETYKQIKAANETQILKSKLQQIEIRIKDVSNEITELRSQIEQKENDIKFTEEQINNIHSEISRVENEIEKKQSNIEELEKNSDITKAKHSATLIELSVKKSTLDTKQKDFDILNEQLSESESKVDKFNAQIIEKIKQTTEIKSDINKIRNIYEQLNIRKLQIIQEKLYNESQTTEKETKQKAVLHSIKEIESEMELLNSEKDFLEKERNKTKVSIEKDTENQAKVAKKLNDCTSKYKILSELEKSYEGYYKSVKSILMQKNSNEKEFSGICGAVGELLQTKETYEVAIEIALGSAVQNIITKDENDARKAIEFLKRNKDGRATFLPISAIKPRDLGTVKESILKEKGVMGIGKDLIYYDEEYENIFSNLLGKVIIVDSMENAIPLNKKYNYAYKIVTLDGELLNIGGSMTGGSVNSRNANFFTRSRELKELQENIEKFVIENENITSNLDKLKDSYEQIILRLEHNRETIQKKALDKATLQQNITQVQNLLADLYEKKKNIILEESQLAEKLSDADTDVQKFEQQNVLLEKEISDIQLKLTQFQSTMTSSREIKENKIRELTDLKVEISAMEQNVINIENELNRMKSEKIVFHNDIVGLLSEKDNKNAEKEAKKEYIVKLQTQIEFLFQKQKENTDNLQRLDTEKDVTYGKIAYMETEEKQIIETMSSLKNEHTRLEMKNEQTKEDRRKMFDQMWDEYNITYNLAKEYKSLDMSFEQMKKEERLQRTKIQEMGNINVGAIEEYKSVKNRFETMSKQRDDIIEAEEKLNELIKELTTLMENQFREQFYIISDNFNTVFKEMFGGGNAHLKLADENNILESGIDIIAQPPGKTLQSMSLLSGGERALTATALLFGILRMKPSPFCILDEVEAALDDANVIRYANFLKNFAKDTQFILITHRKGTMEAADVLYGVTMQEQGVSKLVSVNFETLAV